MNLGMLIGISFVVLLLGYIFYGRYLAKQWGVDFTKNALPTPAHELYDGIDYCPAKTPVLMGHHFSSIAGAGPINGPIMAAFFGWLPVTLWLLIGGIFVGGVHDFGTLFASVRNRGNSIASVIGTSAGAKPKRLFLVFAYLAMLLYIAAQLSIVSGTFGAEFSSNGELLLNSNTIANSVTAIISVWFIVAAIVFGVLVYRYKFPVLWTTIFTLLALGGLMYLSFSFHPFYFSSRVWLFLLALYVLVASVTPVWILLQPRDYLSSYLLYAMMAIALVSILWLHPTVAMPAFTGFKETTLGLGNLFPFLFITVACGAVSGFHALVSSGTSSKQLDREGDALMIGYGGMLIESLLAVVSLCAIAYIWKDIKAVMESGTEVNPTIIFARGLSTLTQGMFKDSISVTGPLYTFFVLSVSVFCLTSLDTATRIARYMFQELWIEEGQTQETVTGYKRILTNKYFATLFTVTLGVLLGHAGYVHIWPLFGATNQLLAALALLGVASWLRYIGRNNRMIYIPMAFMLVVTFVALAETIVKNYNSVLAGDVLWSGIRLVIAGLLLLLALKLVFNVLKRNK